MGGGASVCCPDSATKASLVAIMAGHVRSRGECQRCLGVSKKRRGRSVSGPDCLRCLAQAVELVVSLPCILHVSAVLVQEQYRHISGSLRYLVMCSSFRKFMQRGLIFRPNLFVLLDQP